MNKKFLSVVLSASMVLSPLGGNYCFASSSNERTDLFDSCMYSLKKCANKNIEKNLKVLSISKERNKTVQSLKKNTFSFPSSAYLSADGCIDALEDCSVKNAELDVEILKNTSKSIFQSIFKTIVLFSLCEIVVENVLFIYDYIKNKIL